MEGDLRSGAILGPEALLVGAFCTGVDHRLGRIQDTLRRAIVLFEQDDLSFWEVLLKLANVPHIGSPEEVDRLVVITNHKKVAVACTQLADQRVLRAIGILVLIDQQVGKAILVALQQLGVLGEEVNHLRKQIVEVECIRLAQELLVAWIAACNHLIEGAPIDPGELSG